MLPSFVHEINSGEINQWGAGRHKNVPGSNWHVPQHFNLPRNQLCVDGQWDGEIEARAFALRDFVCISWCVGGKACISHLTCDSGRALALRPGASPWEDQFGSRIALDALGLPFPLSFPYTFLAIGTGIISRLANSPLKFACQYSCQSLNEEGKFRLRTPELSVPTSQSGGWITSQSWVRMGTVVQRRSSNSAVEKMLPPKNILFWFLSKTSSIFVKYFKHFCQRLRACFFTVEKRFQS